MIGPDDTTATAKVATLATKPDAAATEKAAKRAAQITEYEANNDPSLSKLERYRRNANVPMTVYMSLVHIGALFGLWAGLFKCTWATLAFSFVLYFLSALGITAGVHRLWSHRSYKAALPYRIFMMLLNSLANQGTIYHWARDHRVHHLKCETDADPHNAERGFFFSHVGWLLVKKDPRVIHAGQDLDLRDLDALPEVRFQRKLDPVWNLFWCFAFPALVARYLWGEPLLQGFLVAGVFRYVYCLHITWLVNSAAHAWGFRPYEKTDHHGAWPSENAFVSLTAIGEGWHNWHHAYPYDYAASELGVSQQFNPTKLVIDAAACLGLVTGRKRALRAWDARKTRLGKASPPAAHNHADGHDHHHDGGFATLEELIAEREGEQRNHAAAAKRHRAVARPVQPHRVHESTFGVPLFRYRRIVTSKGDSREGWAPDHRPARRIARMGC